MMRTTIQPRAEIRPHMGKLSTCHVCGGVVHSDCDPKRNGWLRCASCGPVWMPLEGHWIRVRLYCSLEEASERAARVVVALEGAGR